MTIEQDHTGDLRRALIEAGVPELHLAQEEGAGHAVWDTKSLQQDFEVLGFLAPFVVVKRRSDGAKGTLEFTHSPRWYFNFESDGE